MFLKKSLALFLTIALCLSLSMTAFAAGTDSSASMEGAGTVEATEYNVVVPGNLNFTLDPYMAKNSANQLYAPAEFGFINKGDFDVKVTLALDLQTASGVTLVNKGVLTAQGAGGAGTELRDEETAKKAFVAAMVSTSATTQFASPSVTGSGFDPTVTTSLFAFDADKKASFGFKLDKATDVGDTGSLNTLGAKGAGSFVLYGEITTYAGWVTNDLKVSGKYTLSPVRTGQTLTTEAGTHNAIQYTPPEVFGFKSATMDVSKTSGGTTPFNKGTKTIEKVYFTDFPTVNLAAADYELTSGDTVFGFKNTCDLAVNAYYKVGDIIKITLEFDDGVKSSISVNIKA